MTCGTPVSDKMVGARGFSERSAIGEALWAQVLFLGSGGDVDWDWYSCVGLKGGGGFVRKLNYGERLFQEDKRVHEL